MKKKNKLILLLLAISILNINANQNNYIRNDSKKITPTNYFFDKENIFLPNDTIVPIKMGSIDLSEEFKPFLNVDKNSGVNIFQFEAPYKGNIILNGFVSAGTYGKMLYTKLIKNGKTISEKTCGIGSPLYNGPFNFQTLVNKGDKLSIQIIVQDHNWQLHCCPDLYNCTYIFTKS